MKVLDLLEAGSLKNGHYQLPYGHMTRRDRGLAQLYNQIIPTLARTLEIPARNFKFDGWSTEKGTIIVKITSSKTEIDMLLLMLPRALKAELEAVFPNVRVSDGFSGSTIPTNKGTQFKQVCAAFATDYPEKWIEWDKQIYGSKA